MPEVWEVARSCAVGFKAAEGTEAGTGAVLTGEPEAGVTAREYLYC